MAKRLNVGIIFGGKSAEHEVSLRSAANVVAALDRKKYRPVLIGIDKKGRWRRDDEALALLLSGERIGATVAARGDRVALVPQAEGILANFNRPRSHERLDVIFPVLHGPFGEDGTVQGLLKLADVPFVGAGVLGSAVGMDKDVQKRLLREAGLPVGKFLALRAPREGNFAAAVRRLGLPFFVKPANLGSSVGVSKVRDERGFRRALKTAFAYDRKVLVEEFIDGREIECAVLGNERPLASVPGEVVVNDDFYSYAAKYLDENGARLEIPAQLPAALAKKIRGLAVRVFSVLEAEGLARVDFFLKKNGAVVVNEINTLPGFTSISMYPRLWQASGVSYSELIDRLLGLARERYAKERRLKVTKADA